MENSTRIIEISGVKMMIDERTATTIDHYKVGQKIKVLLKEYQNSAKVCQGIITDFFYSERSDGTPLGAIQVLIVEDSYSGIDLKFKVYTNETNDMSIAPLNDYEAKIPMTGIVEKFDREIESLKEKIRVLEVKKSAYLDLFENLTK